MDEIALGILQGIAAAILYDAAWQVAPNPNPPGAPRRWKLYGGFACESLG